jgi:dTDP-4-amino-4,6-dideoxygalactose transaminase
MKVPLLDLQAQLQTFEEEMVTAVTAVVRSTRYIGGPEIESLEKEISDYSGAAYGIGVASGTDALLVSLMALDIGEGDLVLTTPYSFFATMGVILRLGARPVFADIDPVSYNIDPDKIAQALADDKDKKIKAQDVLEKHTNKTIVICNRVETIQNLYVEIKKKKNAKTVLLCIHSRFFDSDRKRQESKIKEYFGKNSNKN